MTRNDLDTNFIPPRQAINSLAAFPALRDVAEVADQWLSDFPGVAAGFTHFQAEMYSVSDAFNGGMAQDWNWEHVSTAMSL
jgi:hypothetical protein